MEGYARVTLGADDSNSSPTCDTTKDLITKDAPCTATTNWDEEDSLCLTGSIPALPVEPSDDDYKNNWGVEIGVNATTDEPSGPISKSFSTVTLNWTGGPSSGYRILLHKQGELDDATYGIAAKSGTAYDITKFSSTPWEPAKGTFLTAADATSIDKIMLQVYSGGTAIEVNSLCLKSIVLK